ncbi:MAG TPA: hypothetical protein DCF45_05895 [Gammaproteobacteria bacterium]|nr:hypothetical protein [Gammaproteobacteria bacterium]
MKHIRYFFWEAPPHFYTLMLGVFMQLIGSGEGYRFAFHLNLLIVIAYFLFAYRKLSKEPAVIVIACLPVIYIVLNTLSGSDLVYSGEIRTLIFSSTLAISIWIIDQKDPDYLGKIALMATTITIIGYTTTQTIAIFAFKQPFGTLTNPHYLSLGSSIAFIITTGLYLKSVSLWKYALIPALGLLGFFIIHSSSRPIWFGLLCSSILLVVFIDKRFRISSLAITTATITILLTGNIGGVLDRTKSLITQIKEEERVTLWKDTWAMQKESSYKEWFVGHGLKSFEDDFKDYSTYHTKGTDLNSPHNYILEALYLSGLAGLILLIIVITKIYIKIFQGLKDNDKRRSVYLLLLCLITANTMAASITVPLFSRYNLTCAAIVVGSLLVLDQKRLREST